MTLETFQIRIPAYFFKIHFYVFESIEHKAQRIKIVQNSFAHFDDFRNISNTYTRRVFHLYSLCSILYAFNHSLLRVLSVAVNIFNNSSKSFKAEQPSLSLRIFDRINKRIQ